MYRRPYTQEEIKEVYNSVYKKYQKKIKIFMFCSIMSFVLGIQSFMIFYKTYGETNQTSFFYFMFSVICFTLCSIFYIFYSSYCDYLSVIKERRQQLK